MKKRVLSALLTLCMMLTMAPVAFAAGEGTKDNPFTSVEQYNDAVKTGDWDGKDIYLKIAGTANERKTINAGEFNLTNVQKKFNPPQLHLTIEYCDFNGNTSGDTSENTSFMYLSNCQELVIDNCTFDATDAGLKYGINWNLIQIEGATVSITNSSFTGKYGENAIKLNQRNGEDDVYKTDINPTEGAGSKFAATIKSATISGCTFSGTNAIILLGSAGKGESGNAAPSTGAFPVTITAAENSGANVFLAYLASEQDATDAASKPEEAVQKGLAVQLQANDTALKTTNGDFASPDEFVAKIGDDKYTSLQSAVDAVTLGEETTITLLDNASGNGVKIQSGNKIIFDLGGFTYTIDGETVGSADTETNGFQLLKNSNITFKNGTITSTKAKILIQNYSNLTLDQVTLNGTELAGTTPYTLSNNFGDITIKDSTIMAHDNGYAFDVYYWPSNGYTEGVSVTVEGDSKIEGNVQYGSDGTDSGKQNVAEKASLNITGGTFTGELSLGQIGTSTKAGISISGGTFQGNDTSNWTDYVQSGMKLENGAVVIDTTTAVAKIGDVGYDTLQNAITAAKDGDTVTVLKDITLTSPVTISGTNVTLDLGGKTVSNANGTVLLVNQNCSLTIQNGTLLSTNKNYNTTVDVYPGAMVKIDKTATIIGPYGVSLADHTNEGGKGVTINVYGTVRGITDEDSANWLDDGGAVGIGVNGLIKSTTDYATIHIYKGAVVSGSQGSSGNTNNNDGPAIYAAGYAKWIIDEGATLSGSEALSIKSGNFTINGGTFTATGTFADPATSWGNGTEATGAAISITNHNSYAKNVEMVISGGTFTSEKGYAIYESDTNTQQGSAIATDGLNITGGTFTGGTEISSAVYSKKATEFIEGGTFSTDLSADEYEGYLSNDVKYQVNHKAGTFSYAKTLADAQKLAKSGDTITELNVTPGTTTYTLTLNYNDGATANVTYTVASGTEVPLPTPSRTNYTFGGWKAADGTIYNAGNSYKVETDGVTLTAQWTYTGGSSGGGGGGGAATYSVSTPSSVANGTISVSPKSAAKDATVTVTVKPNTGYVLDTLTVKDADGKAISVTKKSATEYTFKMPASKVTISATFAAETVEPTSPFSDVATSAYYYDAVLWAVENDITNGTTATTFSPNADVSRAQMVTFLWRAAGSPKATGVNPFTDVKSSDYYYDAVLWAVANGVTNGTTETTFSPEKAVSRAQAVTFQWRAAGSPAASGNSFADVAADAYYADAVTWAVANEITNGMSATSFGPDVTVSRAQAVTFLYRAAN